MKGFQILVYENKDAMRVCFKHETMDYWFVVKTFKETDTFYLKISSDPIAEQARAWTTPRKRDFKLCELMPTMSVVRYFYFLMEATPAQLCGEPILGRCPDGVRIFCSFSCRDTCGTLAVHLTGEFNIKSIKIFSSGDVTKIASYYNVEPMQSVAGLSGLTSNVLNIVQTAVRQLW